MCMWRDLLSDASVVQLAARAPLSPSQARGRCGASSTGATTMAPNTTHMLGCLHRSLGRGSPPGPDITPAALPPTPQVCRTLMSAVTNLESLAHAALEDLTRSTNTVNLERVRKIKTKHQRLTGKVVSVREAIQRHMGGCAAGAACPAPGCWLA